MAVEFMDGLDSYEDDTAMQVGGFGASNWTHIDDPYTSDGRFGGGCIKVVQSGRLYSRNFAGATTIIGAGSFYIESVANPQDGVDMLILREGTTDHVEIRIRVDSGYFLQIYAGGAYRGVRSTEELFLNTWYNIQVKAYIHDSAGYVEVQVNGAEWLNETGIDTKNGGTTGIISNVGYGGHTASNNRTRWDDLAAWTTTGDAPTDLVPDFVIEPIRPNADGATVQFTKSGGAANFEMVDDDPHNDGDSTYNSHGVIGEKDRLALPSLGSTPDTIYAVQTVVAAKKSDAGASAIQVGVYSNSSTEGLSGVQSLSTDYTFVRHLMTENPTDTSPWAEADIDALQLQYEVA
jgi:hypothetical protein